MWGLQERLARGRHSQRRPKPQCGRWREHDGSTEPVPHRHLQKLQHTLHLSLGSKCIPKLLTCMDHPLPKLLETPVREKKKRHGGLELTLYDQSFMGNAFF